MDYTQTIQNSSIQIEGRNVRTYIYIYIVIAMHAAHVVASTEISGNLALPEHAPSMNLTNYNTTPCNNKPLCRNGACCARQTCTSHCVAFE